MKSVGRAHSWFLLAPSKMDSAECRGLICGVIMGVCYQRNLARSRGSTCLNLGAYGLLCRHCAHRCLSRYRARGHIDRSFALASHPEMLQMNVEPPAPVPWKKSEGTREMLQLVPSTRFVVSYLNLEHRPKKSETGVMRGLNIEPVEPTEG
jgi:hypothetical protein